MDHDPRPSRTQQLIDEARGYLAAEHGIHMLSRCRAVVLRLDGFPSIILPVPPGNPMPASSQEHHNAPPARRHGRGFRSVSWDGRTYAFTEAQSRVVKLLWEAWENGTPDVPDNDLISSYSDARPPSRLVDAFRGCEAWGTLVVEGATRGTHRLAD